MKRQLSSLYSKLGENNLDALLITKAQNVTYLSDFKGEDCYILFANGNSYFLADFRNFEEARQALGNFRVVQIVDSFFRTVPLLLKKIKAKRLGFEAKHLDFATHSRLKTDLKKSCKLIPTYDLIEDIRQIKSAEEIKLIRRAISITKGVFAYAKKIISPQIKTGCLINQLERFIKSKGADGFSFEPIVASGRLSAYPHARGINRKIGNNTALTIDLGVSFKGYKSDLTRVYFLGRITAEIRRTYEIVLEAQQRAISKIKSGISAAQIDKEARRFITQKGFGRFFQHGTGHGIGLEVHEAPFINKKAEKPLVPGMIFTVEPAIYIPKRFGVRIEDMVLVKEEGCEVLSGDIDKSA